MLHCYLTGRMAEAKILPKITLDSEFRKEVFAFVSSAVTIPGLYVKGGYRDKTMSYKGPLTNCFKDFQSYHVILK